MSILQATINHLCHKTFPYIICIFLLWTSLGLHKWQSYVIIALMIFVERYNYKIGYFSCIVENSVNTVNAEGKNGTTLED